MKSLLKKMHNFNCESQIFNHFSLIYYSFQLFRQYVGEHIKCQTDKSIPDHVIDSFCFFTTTFTVVCV